MYNHRRQTTSTTSPAATATPSVLGFFKRQASPPAATAASAAGSWAPALAKTLSMDSRSGQGELRTKAIDAEAAFLSANKPSLKRPLESNTQALPQKRVLPPGFGSTPSYPTTSSYSSSSYKSHSSAYKAASSSKSGKTEFRFDDPASKALSTSSLRATAATKPLGKRSTPTDPSTTSNSSSTAPFKIASEPGITLTNEQSRVLDLVANGENLFYTGSAGTGKSVLMRQIINGLRTRMTRDQIAITAPTGIAATNIGGVTLHSFAGCGLAIVKDLVKKSKQIEKACRDGKQSKS
ncbi:hypothetical protein BDR26DRAFT_40498 [Obelidium mucronatum]|nr:hypothetical protein BDR26DRAFT_40498 [Obelidium mucronatum]